MKIIYLTFITIKDYKYRFNYYEYLEELVPKTLTWYMERNS